MERILSLIGMTRHDIIGGDAIHAQARIEWQEKKED